MISTHLHPYWSFLMDMRSGDKLVLHKANGQSIRFNVVHADIVNSNHSANRSLKKANRAPELKLTMQYPFDQHFTNRSMQYVVSAELKRKNREASLQ